MTGTLHHIVVLAPLAGVADLDAAKARAAAAELAADFTTLILACAAPGLSTILPGEHTVWAGCSADAGIGELAAVAASCLSALSDRMRDRPLLVLAPPGPDGEALAALVAAALGFQPLGRCEGMTLTDTGLTAASQRGGRIRRQIACAAPATAILRPVGAPPTETPATIPPEALSPARDRAGSDLTIERRQLEERQAGLEGARLVVSGGRGLDPDGFALLGRIADRLGGAVGASLPAIDLGLAPVSRQVGQSGKFVSPDIYLAVGLSGTPQHLAGIAPVSRIIAVNSDPQAPIFQFAELGLVADWREALPALLAALD